MQCLVSFRGSASEEFFFGDVRRLCISVLALLAVGGDWLSERKADKTKPSKVTSNIPSYWMLIHGLAILEKRDFILQ